MYTDCNKVILVDCDGVLLDWEYAFRTWMHSHQYEIVEDGEYDVAKTYALDKPNAKKLVRMFNESAAIGFLPPLRDAIHYIRKLHEQHGFVFHCITSLSTDAHASILRKKNLDRLFGEGVFEKLECLPCGGDKDEALAPYANSGCYWVEDKVENAEVGQALGLNSILIAHDHNAEYKGTIPRAQNWKEIYEKVTNCG